MLPVHAPLRALPLATLATLATLALALPPSAACLDLGLGEEPECRFNSDCDSDEECDDGECVEEDDDEGGEGEGEGGEGEGEGGEGEGGEGEGEGGEGEGEGGEGEGEGGEGEGEGPTEEVCGNFVDDDGDTFADCRDFDCDFDVTCFESCDNGFDDDGDGRADCADGACADTPACVAGIVSVQDVQSGGVAPGITVTVQDVFVTAARTGSNGNVNLYVQEPEGAGDGFAYPQFAGVSVFIPAFTVAALPDAQGLVVGDCVSMTGIVEEFNGETEITDLTALNRESGCGAFPAPAAVDIASVATDTDLFTLGDQPGFLTEAMEGVLVTVADATAFTDSDAFGFDVTDPFGSTRLQISDFLLAFPPTVTAGTDFTSISGVFHTFNNTYELMPRTESEIVFAP